jgi:hypothetical protein
VASTSVPERNLLTQGWQATFNDELGHAAWKYLDCYEESHTVGFRVRRGKGPWPLGCQRHLSRSRNIVPGISEVTSVEIISLEKEERGIGL